MLISQYCNYQIIESLILGCNYQIIKKKFNIFEN